MPAQSNINHTTADLAERHCKACEGGVEALDATASKELLRKIHSAWNLNDGATQISRTFEFRNYYQTTAFINAVAWIAHTEDHHPDIKFGYKQATIDYSTHAVDGLSENDFICAAKIDRLLIAD